MADRMLPAGAVEDWQDHGAGRIRVLRAGPPPPGPGRLPVLLIHGGGYDNAAISWSKIFAPLAADRLVIAPDLPGFGATEGMPVTGEPVDLAELMIIVARSYRLERFAVVGLSMGGAIAVHVALRHPDVVAALVLVAPGGLTERLKSAPTQLAAWLAAQLPDRVLYGLGHFAGRFSDSYLNRMVHDPTVIDADVRAAFAREARRPGSGVGYGRYNQATLGPLRMRHNLLPVVSGIATPTLFLHGEEDPLVDPANSAAAAAAMPRAELVLVAHCGHWLPIEAPDVFLSAVQDFLGPLP